MDASIHLWKKWKMIQYGIQGEGEDWANKDFYVSHRQSVDTKLSLWCFNLFMINELILEINWYGLKKIQFFLLSFW